MKTVKPQESTERQAVLVTQGPPSPNLPSLDESSRKKDNKVPDFPAPKPSNSCGRRDKACKQKKEKEQKDKEKNGQVGAITPDAVPSNRMLASRSIEKPFGGQPQNELLKALLGDWHTLSDLPFGTTQTTTHAASGYSPVLAPAVQSGGSYPNSYGEALISPRYHVGTGGEDLYSGNYNWNLPLVSLPGRGGLDLNLTLSYNSMVWMPYNNGGTPTMTFDWYFYNHAGLTPGFQLGVPEIIGPYFNYAGNWEFYVVVLPNGRNVELKKIATNTYLATDDSYLHLTINPTSQTMKLRANDGTVFSFNSSWLCTEIKDANGNYITIDYQDIGNPAVQTVISKITDTLGREIIFVYDSYYHLQKIKQMWNGVEHIYAQFDYDNWVVQSNFSGIAIDGPLDNSSTPDVQENTIPVLTRVIADDGERHVFTYNSWGIVEGIWRYGAADNQLAAMLHYYPTSTQTNVPHFSERADWAYDWLGVNSGNSNEWSRLYYSFATDSNAETVTLPGGGSGKAGKVTLPDGTIQKELYTTTGWQAGIPLGTETWALENGQSVKKRWSATTWQSSSTLAPLNPRVTLSTVYDSTTNYRTTEYDYTTISNVNLPAHLYESGSSGFIRTTTYNYLTGSAYVNTNRRIIGLPSEVRLTDASNNLASRVTYLYDSTDTGFMQDVPNVIRHDSTNFGTSLIAGRGNLTNVRRWDVNDQNGNGAYTETKTAYNKTGSVIFTRDALDHQTDIEYTDSFSDNVNRNTYAYPTKVTDPDGRVASPNFYSTMKYDFNFGGMTSTTNPKGATATTTYDTGRRVIKVKNEVSGAYTKYIYYDTLRTVDIYTTISDSSLPDTLAARPEKAFTEVVYDGVGRVKGTASSHPGSLGGYRATYNFYNKLGQLVKTSNPTEVTDLWSPIGDDNGFIYTQQAYDWKGRPTITTNQDGTTRQIQYEGCGCAGGQVTTITDEVGRKQKAYSDVLGRTSKTEVLDSSNSVYSATTMTYNVRDQVTVTKTYQGVADSNGDCPSGTCQQAEMVYDGYGRLQKRYLPIYQETNVSPPYNVINSSARFMSWQYSNDDSVSVMTDPRGATATYSYNNRGLVTDITYNVPSNNPVSTDPLYVEPTAPVHYTYDSAGNRLTMTDGIGTVDYVYDTLSRMTSETRYITEINKSFSLTYGYNLAGQVTQLNFVSPAFPNDNFTTNNQYDKTGRLIGVTGPQFSDGGTQYASQVTYRAFDAVKTLTYGSLHTSTATYDSRLQLRSLDLKRQDGVVLTNKAYYYHNDGRLKFANDLTDAQFNRAYQYDHAGRLTESWTGVQAQNFYNGVSVGTTTVPYHQAFTYDVWGNRLTNTGKIWTYDVNETETYNSQTLKHDGWQYDNAGNVVDDSVTQLKYDAAGRNLSLSQGTPQFGVSQATQAMDGDGLVVRQNPNTNVPIFYINSSVLGGKPIAQVIGIDLTGADKGKRGNSEIYFGETRIATISGSRSDGLLNVIWQSLDPLTATKSRFWTNAATLIDRHEPDSMGINVDLIDPSTIPPPPEPEPEPDPSYCVTCGAPPNPSVLDPNRPQYYENGFRLQERFAIQLFNMAAANLDNNVQHDFSTLNRAGILGHWERNKETEVPDHYDENGVWTIGGKVQAGSSYIVDRVISEVHFFSGIKNQTQEIVDKSGSALAIRSLLNCRGFAGGEQFNHPNGEAGDLVRFIQSGTQFLRAAMGVPNVTAISKWEDKLRDLQRRGKASSTLLVCHSNGCPTLAAALSNLRSERNYRSFQVKAIIAVAPDTSYDGDYSSLQAATNNLTVAVSARDTALNWAQIGGKPRINSLMKRFPNANWLITDQRGHGIEFYVPTLNGYGYCEIPFP